MSVECEEFAVEPRGRIAAWGSVAAIALAAHVGLAFGPLRLNTDSARYLEAAANLADGKGYTIADSEFLVFPPGYSLFLAAMDSAGMAGAPALALANVALYALGAWLMVGLVTVGRGDRVRGWALALSSIVALRHTGLAVSEHLFIALTGIALGLGARAGEAGSPGWRAWWLASGVLVASASMVVRTIGVATILVLVWFALELRLGRARLASLRTPLVTGSGLVLAGILFMTPYGESWRAVALDAGTQGSLLAGQGGSLLGAFANVPLPTRWPLLGIGRVLAGGLLLIAGWRSLPWHLCSPAAPFMVIYAAIILLWPYEDSRFWLPLIPMAIPCLLGYLEERHRMLGRIHLACFLCGAVIMCGVQARVALMGHRLPEEYYASRAPHFARDYREAWSSAPDEDISRYALIIRRFERRSPGYSAERSRTVTEPVGSSRNPG